MYGLIFLLVFFCEISDTLPGIWWEMADIAELVRGMDGVLLIVDYAPSPSADLLKKTVDFGGKICVYRYEFPPRTSFSV